MKGLPSGAAVATVAARGPARTLCPNAVLAVLAMGALVWVPVLNTAGALLFLASGGLLMLRNPGATAAGALRFWYVFALPLYCLASTFWSDYPGLTFRFALQLLVTVAIAVTIATRVAPVTFLRCLFMVFLTTMIASLIDGNPRGFDGAWLGVFGSKNALAAAAATFLVLTTTVSLDRTAPAGLRALALAGIPAGAVLLIAAQSAGALLIAAPVLLTIPLILFARVLSPRQKLAAAALALVLAGLGATAFLAFRESVFALLLDQTGKDATLTGRTDLWRIAAAHIAERPVFGLGYQAFWVQSNASAETIWRLFGIGGRGGFNFHNTYISNAVELGIAGVLLQVTLLWGALVLAARWAFCSHRADAVFAFAVALMVVLSSFVEVQVFFQFSITTVNVIAIFVFGVRALTERGISAASGPVPAPRGPAPADRRR